MQKRHTALISAAVTGIVMLEIGVKNNDCHAPNY